MQQARQRIDEAAGLTFISGSGVVGVFGIYGRTFIASKLGIVDILWTSTGS